VSDIGEGMRTLVPRTDEALVKIRRDPFIRQASTLPRRSSVKADPDIPTGGA